MVEQQVSTERLLLPGNDADLMAVLTRLGFEPQATTGRVLLHNCPFHALATRHTSWPADSTTPS
ncbi:hypothetical protein [Dactylosporangium sp. NPDC048998]|uniref:hypothetical protein n=1 Tax=Dactylosporangium sp. NPDC048998 TaxID=3363976 RepID=UPI003719E722